MVNIVEKMRKTKFKTLRKFGVKFCVKKHLANFMCKKPTFSHIFSEFLTTLSTVFLPLFKPKLFHYSTTPTITTTYKIIERIKK